MVEYLSEVHKMEKVFNGFEVQYVSVGTLKTGYPRIQVLSQDKEQSMHSRAAT
jgi:hypothetical protein